MEKNPEHSSGVEKLVPEITWREPFEWEEPEEWQHEANLEVLSKQMLASGQIEAGWRLLQNRDSAQELYGWRNKLHTPPAAEHYRHTYLWDSGFFIMIYSMAATYANEAVNLLEQRLVGIADTNILGGIGASIAELIAYRDLFNRAADEETHWLLEGQRDDGFIPNVRYAEEGHLDHEFEKMLQQRDRKGKKANSYTQPPVLPHSVLAQFKAKERMSDPNAKLYLEETYNKLANFMQYFDKYRSNGAQNKLIGVVHPHETGMDSSPQWDYIKPDRLERSGPDTDPEIDKLINRFIDGAYFVILTWKRRYIARGDLQKEREIFWANDVSMNAIYFHNLQAMIKIAAELGKAKDVEVYQKLTDGIEQAILVKMWQTNLKKIPKKGFYSLKADGEPIETITISNLFGLVLPNLSEEQLGAVLDMMDQDFNEPYPLPSVSKNSPNYDPHNQEKDRLWRGPTWINTNYYLVEFGLRMQAERQNISQGLRQRCEIWAERIAQKSNELIDINASDKPGPSGSGAYEHYDSITGDGQRGERVINFGWTWLARFMSYKKSGSEKPAPAKSEIVV